MKTSGKVAKLTEWGKLDLQYKIKKENSGFFLFYELELDSKTVRNVSDKLRVDEAIVRYLLIRKEN
jgi:small subunit ribosomal protein S6